MRSARSLAAIAAALSLGVVAPSAAHATTRTASPSTLASTFSAAQAGDTIELASGSYSFSGGAKSGNVTLQPASGASVTMSASLNSAAFVTLKGMTLSNLGIAGKTHDVKVLNNKFTGQADLNMTGNANANILLDGNTFDGISVCANCHEGRLTVWQYPLGSTPVGVTVSHNHFGGGGQSDGIQDGAYGVVIDGNEFDGVKQLSGYTRHVDSIQLYGQSHTRITNNYLHNFTVAIMAPDGGNHEVINNNAFISPTNGGSAIQLGHHDGTTFIHNTVKGTDVFAFVGSGDSNPNRNIAIKDNVMVGAAFQINGCQSCTNAYNLYSSSGAASGSNSVVGTPVFAGGTSPTAFAGWQLASGSPGKGNADDGTDRGINASGGGSNPTPPTDPTPPPTNPTPPADNPAQAVWTVPTNVRVGQAVTLDGTKSTGDGTLTCTWSFENQDGSIVWETATGCKLTKTFQNADTKYVKLTVKDADGDTNASRKSFAVTR